MFKSLRSRLTFSYTAMIAVVLFLTAIALLALASSNTRTIPTMQQLLLLGQTIRREVNRMPPARREAAPLENYFNETAVSANLRILLANPDTGEILFDTAGRNSWVGQTVGQLERPGRFFNELDPQFPAGRFRTPDGVSWLLFSQPLQDAGIDAWLIVAREEPSPLQFFNDFFLASLCQAGLFAFILALLFGWLMARSISRPLKKIVDGVEMVAAGDYNQQLDIRGPDEVRRLAESFNLMATQVSSSQQAQRDFVANVSHDLKTPLTAVRGWSQSLLDGTASRPEQQERAARIIHTEAQNMTRMVNQLLDLARIESGQFTLTLTPVELGPLLQELHNRFLLPAEEKGLFLTLSIDTPPIIQGDKDRLLQIFTNLVENALTHTPQDGRIDISTKQKNDWETEIRIQDTGPGIPEAELNRIFERFYQIDKARSQTKEKSGTGLGLAIVKELVHAHGGSLAVRSRVGEGTLFIVRLPLGKPPPAGSTVMRRPIADH